MLLYDKYLFEEADDMILGYLMTPKDNDIREYRKKECTFSKKRKKNSIKNATKSICLEVW